MQRLKRPYQLHSKRENCSILFSYFSLFSNLLHHILFSFLFGGVAGRLSEKPFVLFIHPEIHGVDLWQV